MSLVIGLSQRKLLMKDDDEKHTFGSDRTFTLIGILGYMLYVIGHGDLMPFLCGGLTLSMLLMVYYSHKLYKNNSYGITSIFIALITYCLAPIVYEKEIWMAVLIVVSILILAEMRDKFIAFTKSMNDEEFFNLAKFLVIAGVVLPILPKNEVIEGTGLTPYSIWLATVVISGISYISYLVKKYIFKDAGLIITGILGGIYSSTATCIILSKKTKDFIGDTSEHVSAIFFAITMLYFRILVLLGIFNPQLLVRYWHLFVIMILTSSAVAFFFYRKAKRIKDKSVTNAVEPEDKNPLEFKVALLFAALFVAFTLITYYAIQYFGDGGLRILSIIVGVTDINPFIINLFQSQYDITETTLILATFQAIISNLVVQMLYGGFFSGNRIFKQLLCGSSVICAVNIIMLVALL